MFTLQTSFKPLLLKGGERVKFVGRRLEVTVNRKVENFCPKYVQEFGLCSSVSKHGGVGGRGEGRTLISEKLKGQTGCDMLTRIYRLIRSTEHASTGSRHQHYIGSARSFKQCCGSGSGIRDLVPFWPLDPGSQTIFWELSDNFLGKKFHNSLKIYPNFSFSISKIK